jgi:hypothetical protein
MTAWHVTMRGPAQDPKRAKPRHGSIGRIESHQLIVRLNDGTQVQLDLDDRQAAVEFALDLLASTMSKIGLDEVEKHAWTGVDLIKVWAR